MADQDVDNWTCPILQTVMRDPVVAADGHTYERAAMEEWFRSCRDAEVTSPLTGFPLPSRILFANHNLRKSIAEYVSRNPEAEKLMTTKEEIADIVSRFRSAEARPDSPPLIDLRSDEEIAAAAAASSTSSASAFASAAKPARPGDAAEVTAVPLPRATGSYAASASAAPPAAVARSATRASYTLAPPSTLLIGSRISHHSQSNELDLYEANKDGYFCPRSRVKMNNSATFTCASVLRMPSSDAECNVESQYVVTGGSNGSISVWAYGHQNGPQLRHIPASPALSRAHSEGVSCLTTWAHSVFVDEPDSRPIIVSGSRDRSVKIWRAGVREPVAGGNWDFELAANLEKHTDFVTCCEVEVGSGTLLTGGGDWKTCLWDLHRLDAGCVSEFEAHSYAVRCCAWSTSGQHAVNGYQIGYSANAGGDQAQRAAGSRHAPVGGACFASGGDDEMVYVIDPRAGYDGKVARLSTGAAVLSVCWGPTEDAQGELPWLAAGGGVPLDSFNASSDNIGGWVRVWDPRMWKPVGDCCSFGATPLQDPSGATYDASAVSRTLQIHRASSSDWESDKSREAHATMVAGLSPVRVSDGTIALASVGDDHVLRLWKLPRGPGDSMLKPVLLQNIQTHSSPCYVGLLI